MANFNSFIFTGHGTSEVTGNYDPGATNGRIREHDLAKAINSVARQYIYNNTTLYVHYDESNFTDNDLAGNVYSCKSGISVHINAGGGTGTEIWVPCGERELGPDFKIVSEISTLLGIPNRGVKSRDYNTGNIYKRTNGIALPYVNYYKEINDAWARGISLSILEVGFIDTSDLAKIQANIDGIGNLVGKYVATICGVTASVPTTPTVPTIPTEPTEPTTGTFYRVVCGSFSEKAKAEARVAELKKAGFDSFIEAYKK